MDYYWWISRLARPMIAKTDKDMGIFANIIVGVIGAFIGGLTLLEEREQLDLTSGALLLL